MRGRPRPRPRRASSARGSPRCDCRSLTLRHAGPEQAALSHEEHSIRTDAVDFLSLLLRTCPAALSPAPPLFLSTLTELLGSSAYLAASAGGGSAFASAGGSSSRSHGSRGAGGTDLAVCHVADRSAERQAAVLHAISALLAAQGVDPSIGAVDGSAGDWLGSTGGSAGDLLGTERPPSTLAAESSEAAACRPPRFGTTLAGSYTQWRALSLPAPDSLALTRFSVASTASNACTSAPNPVTDSANIGRQLHSLPAVLTNCWVELGIWLQPAARESVGALDCAAALVLLFRQLLALPPAASGGASLGPTVVPLLLRHVAKHVPLSPSARGAATAQRRRRLNLTLCVLLAEALSISAVSLSALGGGAASESTASPRGGSSADRERASAEYSSEASALRARLVGFVCSQLDEDGISSADSGPRASDWGSRGGRPVVELISACRALLIACASRSAAAERDAVVQTLFRLWCDAPAASPIRTPLLSLLQDTLLPALVPASNLAAEARGAERGCSDLAADWLCSLPKLLWQLHDKHAELTSGILRALISLGRLASGAATQLLHALQPTLEPFFCSRGKHDRPPVLGPFVLLPPATRQLALQLVLRMRPVSAGLCAALARCAVACSGDPSGCRPAVDVLVAVEAAGHCHSLSLQERVSFYLTLLLETRPTAAVRDVEKMLSSAGDAPSASSAMTSTDGEWIPSYLQSSALGALRRAHVQHGDCVLRAIRSCIDA